MPNANTGTVFRMEGSAAPRFSAAAVVNAASFASGLTAGSLATIFAAGVRDANGSIVADRVPLPTNLGGVAITVAGITAPIYSVSNVNGQEQVSFQVPWSVAGRTTVPVFVTRDGQSSATVNVPLNVAQPGVYTSDGSQAIALHAADFALATAARPLARDEFAVVYASGLARCRTRRRMGQGVRLRRWHRRAPMCA